VADSINLDALDRALGRLKSALDYCVSKESQADDQLFQVLRSGAIQGFEFTWELSHKVLRRYLMAMVTSPEDYVEMTYPVLIRKAEAYGLVGRGWVFWKDVRRLRAITSHTYGEACAAEVFQIIPDFFDEVSKMISAMRAEPVPE